MLRMLVWKESRELLPLVLPVAIVQALLVCSASGMYLGLEWFIYERRGNIPFVLDVTFEYVFLVGGALAVALGLWQTMWESSRETFQFLLHRPATRGNIFATKLLLGLAASFLIVAVPTLGYALWAATPGTHASPFNWSMTLAAWQSCVQTPLLYLGAFLSGLRPGRWFGSRFLPLLAAIVTVTFLGTLWQLFFTPPWVAIVVPLAIEACLIVAIGYVAATRDYS